MSLSIVEISTTTETEAQARTLARLLIEHRLAACIQITGPIQSVYRWKGEICNGTEYRLSIKTTREREHSLIESISTNHPYETPEILIDEVHVSDAYGRWLQEQVDIEV